DTDPPDNHTPLGLVSGLLIQAAVEKAGTLDSTKVRAAMNDLNITTLVGPFKIDAKTGMQQGYPMLTTQWRNGKAVLVGPAPVGTPDKFIYPMPAWKDKRGAGLRRSFCRRSSTGCSSGACTGSPRWG